jgi:hypothetical protein
MVLARKNKELQTSIKNNKMKLIAKFCPLDQRRNHAVFLKFSSFGLVL